MGRESDMPTEIRERQLSFVAYVLWRIRIRLAERCFGASKALADWGARMGGLGPTA
jgi:hypothetical protein